MQGRLFFIVFGLLAMVAWAAGEKFGPPSSATADLSSNFVALVNRGVDDALKEINARDRMQVLDAGRPVSQIAVRGPGGLIALSWARESPEGLRWPLVILRPGIGQDEPPMTVDACSDSIIAHGITRLEWSSDGAYLAVLTQSESLDSPGGMLAVMRSKTGVMHVVDNDVIRFAMSADGRHLVFEKAKARGDLTGPRVLVHNDGAAGRKTVLHEVPFPVEQITSLGPVDSKTGKIPVSLKDYSAGLTRPVQIAAEIDLTSGRFHRR